jgi:hypothetical protein
LMIFTSQSMSIYRLPFQLMARSMKTDRRTWVLTRHAQETKKSLAHSGKEILNGRMDSIA